ncbi:MAG: alpha/beta hydrolase family protein [Solirubrobacteraceae bacterium]
MPALTSIQVLHGPDSTVSRRGLREWAAHARDEWEIDLEVRFAGDRRELLQLFDSCDPTGGVILCSDDGAVLSLAAASSQPLPSLVWLDMRTAIGPPPRALLDSGVQIVRGRGFNGHDWALRSLLERSRWPSSTHAYGSDPDQVADLRLPADDAPDLRLTSGAAGHPVVVLIHGGAWRANWERDLMDAMAVDLAERGYASWNLEYRRVGHGGGWPMTFDDVASGIDALGTVEAPLDLERVAFVGHSAGGQLALWAAARADALVKPSVVVSLAGVPDLIEGARRGMYERAIDALMGGMPETLPDRYSSGSPYERLPLGVPQLLIHGTLDLSDNIDLNRRYAERALSQGDVIETIELAEVDHFGVIEPRSLAWATIVAELQRRLPRGWRGHTESHSR